MRLTPYIMAPPPLVNLASLSGDQHEAGGMTWEQGMGITISDVYRKTQPSGTTDNSNW